jgi:hypothetical protein
MRTFEPDKNKQCAMPMICLFLSSRAQACSAISLAVQIRIEAHRIAVPHCRSPSFNYFTRIQEVLISRPKFGRWNYSGILRVFRPEIQ